MYRPENIGVLVATQELGEGMIKMIKLINWIKWKLTKHADFSAGVGERYENI